MSFINMHLPAHPSALPQFPSPEQVPKTHLWNPYLNCMGWLLEREHYMK